MIQAPLNLSFMAKRAVNIKHALEGSLWGHKLAFLLSKLLMAIDIPKA